MSLPSTVMLSKFCLFYFILDSLLLLKIKFAVAMNLMRERKEALNKQTINFLFEIFNLFAIIFDIVTNIV